MSYDVTFFSVEGDEMLGHSSINPDVRLLNPYVVQDDGNLISTFSFSIKSDNPLISFIEPSRTMVRVVDVDTGDLEFEGRVFDDEKIYDERGAEFSYIAEDRKGFLRDTPQKDLNFNGKPSKLFEQILQRHNDLTMDDAHKQFAVGVVEIDTYREYLEDGATGANVILADDATATIKPTATRIWGSWDGPALNIASYIKGVPLKVDSSQVISGDRRYLLYRMVDGSKIVEGIVSGTDIIETYSSTSGSGATETQGGGQVTRPPGTATTIKPNAVNWWVHQSNGRYVLRPIPSSKRNLSYVVGDYVADAKRYALWNGQVHEAYIDAAYLQFGQAAVVIKPSARPGHIDKPRTIETQLDYSMTTYEAITKILLEPYKAEMQWEKIEGVPTLHIRNRIENHTDEYLSVHLNVISAQLETNMQDVYSGIIPIGTKPTETKTT